MAEQLLSYERNRPADNNDKLWINHKNSNSGSMALAGNQRQIELEGLGPLTGREPTRGGPHERGVPLTESGCHWGKDLVVGGQGESFLRVWK